MKLIKIKKKIWGKIVFFLNESKLYPIIYHAYWHSKFNNEYKKDNENNYFTSVPNPSAGIGHQLANWIAGYWFAKQFNLKFAHIPFSSVKWENFLGFGDDEISVKELLECQTYKKVILPLFKENNIKSIELTKKIIQSYSDQKVVFITEQDQFYKDQHGIMKELKQKFYNAASREKDVLIYSKTNFNIAIHVRRGDIVTEPNNKNPNLLMRWQNNEYFEKVLNTTLLNIRTDKKVVIYLFSQGERKNFQEFEKFVNINFCLDMGVQESFLHMVYADILITSKSSFSYKPALISNGIKICPSSFWHSYPKTKDFILVDDFGNFEAEQLIFNSL